MARIELSHSSAEIDIAVPPPALRVRARNWLIWLIVAALLAWRWTPTEMYKIVGLVTDWRNMAEFASGFLMPNFANWRQYVGEMVETVQIALWATALAVFFGIPFAILASSNICPQMGGAADPPVDGRVPSHP